MQFINKISILFLCVFFGLIGTRCTIMTNIPKGWKGVRQSHIAGLSDHVHKAGYMFDVPFVHTVWKVPGHFRFLNYSEGSGSRLQFRTRENNKLGIDLTIPYRIKEDMHSQAVEKGYLSVTGEGRFKFDDMAVQSANEILRAVLAQGSIDDFYDTDKRTVIAENATIALNEKLAQWFLETPGVLIRYVKFPGENERQLAQIQLNVVKKLLDDVKKEVAGKQQELDNFNMETSAQLAARNFDWNRRVSELQGAYNVGVIDTEDDNTPGAVRRVLKGLKSEEIETLRKKAGKALGIPEKEITDRNVTTAHLLGISNIQAETAEYKARVEAEANGTEARLLAEGHQILAEIQAEYERNLNKILAGQGGRGYVAFHAAKNINFDPKLTFRSDEVPFIYRLDEFARLLMGE